jgi:hypothetical protein
MNEIEREKQQIKILHYNFYTSYYVKKIKYIGFKLMITINFLITRTNYKTYFLNTKNLFEIIK